MRFSRSSRPRATASGCEPSAKLSATTPEPSSPSRAPSRTSPTCWPCATRPTPWPAGCTRPWRASVMPSSCWTTAGTSRSSTDRPRSCWGAGANISKAGPSGTRFPRSREACSRPAIGRRWRMVAPCGSRNTTRPSRPWFDVDAYPTPEGLAVYFRDISRRKRDEEDVRVSNERFLLVAQATNDVIWDWDLVGSPESSCRSHSAVSGARAIIARTRRQSSPQNSASNCAWLSIIKPSVTAGQLNVCSSSRL